LPAHICSRNHHEQKNKKIEMKINAEIVKACASYISEFLPANLDNKFTYHNLAHTKGVVEAVELLCSEMNIDKHDKRLVVTAAWFHDIGYTREIENHESTGSSMAFEFLQGLGVDMEEIDIVQSLILSTHYPQQPKNLLQEIICDADMMHLGAKNFRQSSENLRQEWALTRGLNYSDAAWVELNIQFLSDHHFHTQFGIQYVEPKKQKKIKKLESELAGITGVQKDSNNYTVEIKETAKSKKENGKLERGVETLFRSASGNHMRLSSMADNKAHILLSINSIIISIILSVLAKKLVDVPFLVLPTILLLAVSAVSIVFSILTTRPKVSKGVFTKEQIIRREVNLLFFGNFHQMDLDTYEWGIRELMYDKEYLYKSMTKDIYFLGKVLARKYRYLSLGYKVFMYGLIVTLAAYGLSFLMATHMG